MFAYSWNIITQDPSTGSFSGTESSGGASGTLTGTISGTSVSMTSTDTSGYTWYPRGTLASDCSMSGTWTDSNGQSGTWQATPQSGQCSSGGQTWDLATDFAAHPTVNPAPDRYGNSGVWSFMQSSSLARDGNYTLLPNFSASYDGVSGFNTWYGSVSSCSTLPEIGINLSGGGASACTFTVPASKVFVHPANPEMAVVRWKSPISGTVQITGGVASLDSSCGDGTTWYVDQGTSTLASGSNGVGGGTRFPTGLTASVATGDSLYFIVGPSESGGIGCDTTELDVTITAGSSPANCAVSLLPGKHEPGLVAVFVDGVQTSTPTDDFYPLDYGLSGSATHPAVDSYCSPYTKSSYGQFPRSVSGVLGGYVGTLSPPPSLGSAILTDTLARQGAALLPYSYAGAYFSSCPGGNSAPLFHVKSSPSSAPGNTDVNTEASLLWGEVESIHACWPDSAIEVIADSGGGVPAEYYWNTGFHIDRAGVKHIFTLDAPINGMNHTTIESVVDNHLGPVVRDFYGVLWNSLDANDAREIALDADGAFRPIGTIGDYAYMLGDMRWSFNFDPNGTYQQAAENALLSQLLMSCSGGLSDTCTVAAPSYISPCPGTEYSGDPSHEVVRICKPTIDYIAGVTASDLNTAENSQLRFPLAYGARSRAAQTSETDLLAASAATRAPERHVPGSGPAVQPLLYASAPGSRIRIHGRGLGATAGTVIFSGPAGPGTVAGRVLAWTDTAVTVVVPSARSGPIILRTSDGESFVASSLAMLSRGRVAHLRIRPSPPATAGQPEYVYATALDRRSRPVAGVPVDLFNGSADTQRTTNRHGTATFALADFGVQDLLVHSEGAFKPVHLIWRPLRSKLFKTIGISLLRARSAVRDRLVLSIESAIGGAVTARVRICRAQHDQCRRFLRYGSGRANAVQPGAVTLSIEPSRAAVRTLRHHPRVRVQIDMTLRSAATHAVMTATSTVFVTF
jgi:hypothetical protein